jgi:thymidylate synthase
MDMLNNDDGLVYKETVTAETGMDLSYHTIDAENANDAFLRAATRILELGVEVAPRGMKTKEISPMMIRIRNPKDCVISIKSRRMPYKFMAMELMWILSGDEGAWIADYLPRLDAFMDPDPITGTRRLMGGYGPRLRNYFGVDQFRYVIDKLAKDKDSRQALTVIWNPTIDVKGYKDTPCTNLFKFSIRDSRLNMTTFMRSNDLWKGASIDWFNFCTIQCILADILGVGVGEYYHIADSLHIYDTDVALFERVLAEPTQYAHGVPTYAGGTGYKSLDEVYDDVAYARNLKSTKTAPNNDRYLSRLMRWVSSQATITQTPVLK